MAKRIIKVTNTQYDDLLSGKTITLKGDTLTYDAESTYVIDNASVYDSSGGEHYISNNQSLDAALKALDSQLYSHNHNNINGIFKGTCSTAGDVTAKVVTCPEFTSEDLIKGAIIFVTFDYTNSGAVASLTMNVNNTGEKPLKKQSNNSTANLTAAAELQANSTYMFQYDETNWVCMTLDYNSNDPNYHLRYYRPIKTKTYLGKNSLAFLDKETGKLIPFHVSDTETAKNKEMTTEEFDPFSEILLSANAVAANEATPAASLYSCCNSIDLRYTFNLPNNSALTKYNPVCAVCQIQSSGKAKLVSPYYATALPTTNDGKLYIFLGIAYNGYSIELYRDHPIYYHNGTSIQRYDTGIVTQISTNTDDEFYEVLFSKSANDNNEDSYIRKSSKLTFNPQQGTLTVDGLDKIKYNEQTNSCYVFDDYNNFIGNNPNSKYIWYDVGAFCKKFRPNYYTSSDGNTWTYKEIDKRLFDQKQCHSINVIPADGYKYVKFEWTNIYSYIDNTNIQYIMIGFASCTAPEIQIVVDELVDISNWSQIHNSIFRPSNSYKTIPYLIYIPVSHNGIRLIIKKSVGVVGTINLAYIKLLSCKSTIMNNCGPELELPFDWDEYGNILPITNCDSTTNLLGKKLGTISNKFGQIHVNDCYADNIYLSGIDIESYIEDRISEKIVEILSYIGELSYIGYNF